VTKGNPTAAAKAVIFSRTAYAQALDCERLNLIQRFVYADLSFLSLLPTLSDWGIVYARRNKNIHNFARSHLSADAPKNRQLSLNSDRQNSS
jgi:hypothetical protein